MKTKLILAAIVLANTLAFAQMRNWALPPYKFNVMSSPAAPSPLYPNPQGSGAYNVANAAYGYNNLWNTLLFYVEDHRVYNANGFFVKGLGNPLTGGSPSGEIVIVPMPKPNNCKKYYVIYNKGAEVVYSIVDCSGLPVTASNVDNGPGNAGYPIQGFPNNLSVGIAVSKRVPDPNGGYMYHLYMANSGVVYHSFINSSGIGPTTQIHTFNALPIIGGAITELELSPDGNYLAYNGRYPAPFGNQQSAINNSGGVVVLELNTPTSVSNQYTYNWPQTIINGLEFKGGTAPVLFVAGEKFNVGPQNHTNGILEKWDFINSTIIPCPHINYQPKKTFLELTKNGKIAYVCDYLYNPIAINPATNLPYGANVYGNRYFVEYDDVNNTFTPTQIDVPGLDVNPNGTIGTNLAPHYERVYTLPDQNDGENYQDFTGLPPSIVGGMYINNQYVTGNCNFIEVYNCSPITTWFSISSYAGPICERTVDVTEVNANCDQLAPTYSYFNCTNCTGLSSNPNELVHDLRDIVDQEHNWTIGTKPGYYKVTFKFKDCCGNMSSHTAYIKVLGAITTNFPLQIYNGNTFPASWLPGSTSITSPVNVGPASIQYQVPQITGNITGYTTLVEEVDNTGNITGAGTIFNRTFGVNNLNSISPQNLNSFCVSSAIWPGPPNNVPGCTNTNPNYQGYPSYWSYANAQNSYQKYYKISVTLSNVCSSNSAFSYVYVNSTAGRPANGTGIEDINNNAVAITVFPNPAKNELTILNKKPGSGDLKFELFDYAGKKVLQASANKETESQKVDVSKLPDGIYIWKCLQDGNLSTGKVAIEK